VIQDDRPILTRIGKRLAQLLYYPVGGRVTSDVEVQDPATPVPDHEETIQKPEGQRGHGKKIHDGDRLPMIGKGRGPAPRRIATAWTPPSEISGNRAFGDGEAGFKQFPVDLWRAPVRILNRHRRMRVRICSLTFGRPPRGRDRQRQYSRKPARCHATTVAGFTMTRTSDQHGQMLRRVVRKKRSGRPREGRGRLRLSTAICCSRARTSSEVSRRLRKKTRKAARNAGMKSSTKQPLQHCATSLPDQRSIGAIC
jgi:hypothetical protein